MLCIDLISKAAVPWSDTPNWQGMGRKWLVECAFRSMYAQLVLVWQPEKKKENKGKKTCYILRSYVIRINQNFNYIHHHDISDNRPASLISYFPKFALPRAALFKMKSLCAMKIMHLRWIKGQVEENIT